MRPTFSILCFASAYWDEPLWTNKQHIMSRLACDHRVLYVEPGLSILGCIRGRQRLQHPWRRFWPWLRKIHDHLWVWYCPVLPGAHAVPIKRLNLWLQFWMLRGVMRILAFRQPLAWVYRPEDIDLVNRLNPHLVCYDCVDEIAEFPMYADQQMKARLLAAEDALLRRADVVFTTSPHLYETKRLKNPATYYVPNVADVEHFSKARSDSTAVPEDIAALSGPILGFVGAISAYKLDLDLLAFVAETRPDWQIVLIGPLNEAERATIVARLGQCANIHLFGPRPYGSLPRYLKGIDVCLIPYTLNAYTKGVFPMKFFEYMATGKPIVSTALPALQEFDSMIMRATSYETFVAGIAQALRHDSTRRERLEEVAKHTWEARIARILSILTAMGQQSKEAA